MAFPSSRSALVRFLLVLLALGVLAVVGDSLHARLPELERWFSTSGALAPYGFILAMALCMPLLVPDTIFGVLAGLVFGVKLGTAWYFAGCYLGCVVCYELGRGLLQRRVAAGIAARPKLAAVQAAARGEGLRITALLRLTPLSPALVSYLLGTAKVSRPRFLLGSIALLPFQFVIVYSGVVAKHVTSMAAQGHEGWDLHGVLLVTGFVVAAGVVLYVGRIVYRAVLSVPQADAAAAAA